MKETTNLKLKKYDYSDTVDMSTGHNVNMDIIDTEINNVKNSVNNIKLTSDKVTRPNSKTVEESILSLESSDGNLANLATTNKSNLVSAINEAFQFANNGKSSIATVIGSPLAISDTFSSMVTKIQTLKNTLATNNTNKGVPSVGTETLESLVNKIPTMPVKRWASGITMPASDTKNFNFVSGANDSTSRGYCVINLSFIPSVIIVFHTEYDGSVSIYKTYPWLTYSSPNIQVAGFSNASNGTTTYNYKADSIVTTDNRIFNVPVGSKYYKCQWIAFE